MIFSSFVFVFAFLSQLTILWMIRSQFKSSFGPGS